MRTILCLGGPLHGHRHPALTAAPRGPAGFLRRLARKLRPRPTPDPHPRRPAP